MIMNDGKTRTSKGSLSVYFNEESEVLFIYLFIYSFPSFTVYLSLLSLARVISALNCGVN